MTKPTSSIELTLSKRNGHRISAAVEKAFSERKGDTVLIHGSMSREEVQEAFVKDTRVEAWRWITREEARHIIKTRNNVNRGRSDKSSSKLIRDFNCGAVMPSPQTITFYCPDAKGIEDIMDGQDRLYSLGASKVEGHKFIVVSNFPRYVEINGEIRPTFEFVDLGRPRTTLSMLKHAIKMGEIQHLDYPRYVTSSSRILKSWVLRHQSPSFKGWDVCNTNETFDLAKLIGQNVDAVAKIAVANSGKGRIHSVSPTGSVVAMLGLFHATDPVAAINLCRRVFMHVGCVPNDPAVALGAWYSDPKNRDSKSQKLPYQHIVAEVIRMCMANELLKELSHKQAITRGSLWLADLNPSLINKIKNIVSKS